MLRLLCPKHKDAKIYVNHLNPVMLVFIRKLSLNGYSSVFASFCIGKINHQQQKGYKNPFTIQDVDFLSKTAIFFSLV